MVSGQIDTLSDPNIYVEGLKKIIKNLDQARLLGKGKPIHLTTLAVYI
jgi:hypothetical protein